MHRNTVGVTCMIASNLFFLYLKSITLVYKLINNYFHNEYFVYILLCTKDGYNTMNQIAYLTATRNHYLYF